MNIVVCVKQVPDTSEVKIDNKTNNLIREGVPSIVNPYDVNALEEGLLLRDKYAGRVTVVSMGPPQAEQALSFCLEMGADEAILLSDKKLSGSDTLATGYALSKLIESLNADIILCGNETIDGCTGQVGPIIAGNLGIPQFTYVKKFEIEGDSVRVCRDSGKKFDYYEAKLPVVISVLKGINKPRKRAAMEKVVRVVAAEDIGLDLNLIGNEGSPTKVVSVKMSDAKVKSYVVIDSSLDWEARIQMIIDGGIKTHKKAFLWRGAEDYLAQRLLGIKEIKKHLEI